MNHNKEEIVCFLDDSERFFGYVSYNGFTNELLKQTEYSEEEISYAILEQCLLQSIRREYVVFDRNIWKEARKYFKDSFRNLSSMPLLPVVDKNGQLMCFAWDDEEANQEIRMLDELMEREDSVLGFRDVFPEYDGVTVYGFNELVYYFIMYLKQQGILFNAKDEMWVQCGEWKRLDTSKESFLEHKNFIIYGEGNVHKKEKKIEKRDSVSAEFECINQIYELNFCKGKINDTEEKFHSFLNRMAHRQIGIIGTDLCAFNAYDLLLKYGMDIACFISEADQEKTEFLFGKKVISMAEAMERIGEMEFIEPCSQYSALGNREVNCYHYYFGLRRNQKIFFLKDYIDIPDSGLLNVLNNIILNSKCKLVLFGDFSFCLQLKRIIQVKNQEIDERIVYCDILQEHTVEIQRIKKIEANTIKETDICLILMPEHYHFSPYQIYHWEKNILEKIHTRLKELCLNNFIDYPTHNTAMLEYTNDQERPVCPDLKAGKIIIGCIEPYSGNIFFRGLLDNHPDVLILDYSSLNSNLYTVCTRLSEEKAADILALFWQLFEVDYIQDPENIWNSEKRRIFHEKMQEMLSVKEKFTSQELFVMIHIAHAKMWGKDVNDISEMTIYWEPHCVPINQCEEYSIWLDKAAASGCILNLVRDSRIRSGSVLGTAKKEKRPFGVWVFPTVLHSPDEQKNESLSWKRITVKFEDLKCNPQKHLHSLCGQLGIAWSDTLLQTTLHGEQEFYGSVTGFDLAPVYRIHEEFFSTFDRFRIDLITGPWQKKYGYPYIESLEFGRRELQDMFQKEFRFESMIQWQSDEEKNAVHKWVWKLISSLLWKARRVEIMERKEKMFEA
ncbi:MAG: hypothetical protein HFJ05_01720 [Eubacterium sp.]|nr:hypothetical protein [Eubacterium sp.]